MNGFTYEEQGTSRFLVYEVTKSENLDTFVLGMLQNNEITGIIKAFSLQINETVFIRYDITGRQALTDYLEGAVQKKKLLKILRSIMDGMRSSDEYMIKPQMMIMDPEYIYVDVKKGTAGLVCVPVANEEQGGSLAGFLKQFISDLRFDPSEDAGYVAKLLTYLNDGISFSFGGFEKLLNELEKQENTKKDDRETGQPMREPPKKQMSDVGRVIEKPVESADRAKIGKEESGNKTENRSGSKNKEKKPVEERDEDDSNKMSLMHLLMHYSKANLEIYKAQRKEDRIRDTGFSVPGQEPKIAMKDKVESLRHEGVENVKNERKRVDRVAGKEPDHEKADVSEKLDFGDTVIEECGGAYEEGVTVILNETETRCLQEAALVRLSNQEVVTIDREVFRIGREPSKVDYCVSDNNAVGREHATILMHDEKVFLIDNNSTNHTYLNGEKLQSDKEFEIKNKDRIKFADEEFEFRV